MRRGGRHPGAFPSPPALATLLQRIGDPDLRYRVVSALGKLLLDQATPVLVKLLDDKDSSIRVEMEKPVLRAEGATRSVPAT